VADKDQPVSRIIIMYYYMYGLYHHPIIRVINILWRFKPS